MMKKTILRKLLACVLAGAMTLGLAACGKGETETKEPLKDLEGTGEKEEEYVPGTLPLTNEEVTLTIGLAGRTTTVDHETNEYTKWLEEQTGINLEFVVFPFSSDATEFKNQLTLMMTTGEELPDIILEAPFGDDGVKEYGQEGYFIDISGYLAEEGTWFQETLKTLPEASVELIQSLGKTEDGKIYGYPYFAQGTIDKMLTQSFINQKWLEAVGAEVPTTVDELYEVLVKFRDEDPNGNGIADEIPLTGATAYRSATDQWLINAFVYCVDEYAWNVTDGKLWSPYSTDEYREAMIYMNKLVSEKLLSTNVFTGDSATLKPMNTPTEGESIVGAVTCHPTLHMDENSPVIYDYTAIGPLKAAEGSKIGGYAAYYADTYRFTNVITEDCENPELAFRLLDFMSSTESARRQRYGVYGVDWTDAPEGSVTSSGTPAKVETINASVFSEQNNQCWHNVFCQVADSSVTASSYTDDGSGLAQRKGLCRLAMESYASFPVPEETFTNVAYTEEEQETINELLKIYKDYVKEARGLFATGAMDPSSDKDWNSYLEQLEARGQSKLLECAQAAYDRIK